MSKPTGRLRWVAEQVELEGFPDIQGKLSVAGFKLQMEFEPDGWADVPLVDSEGNRIAADLVMVPWKTKQVNPKQSVS